jgi:hypothetical protein
LKAFEIPESVDEVEAQDDSFDDEDGQDNVGVGGPHFGQKSKSAIKFFTAYKAFSFLRNIV